MQKTTTTCIKKFKPAPICQQKFIDSVKQNIECNIEKDVNFLTQVFNNIMHNNINRFAPVFEKRVKTTICVPWLNSDIKTAMSHRDTLRKSHNYLEFKRWRNMCVSKIKIAKQQHYNSIIQKTKGNTIKLWKHINS